MLDVALFISKRNVDKSAWQIGKLGEVEAVASPYLTL